MIFNILVIFLIVRLYLTISWLGLQSVRFRSPH
nr:MAG TPA: hypothetical protein [Bacteriophage sp.]